MLSCGTNDTKSRTANITMYKADSQVHYHHDTEMYRTDAYRHSYRQKDRREKSHCGSKIKEHPDDNQDKVDKQDYGDPVLSDGKQSLCDRLRYTLAGEEP